MLTCNDNQRYKNNTKRGAAIKKVVDYDMTKTNNYSNTEWPKDVS